MRVKMRCMPAACVLYVRCVHAACALRVRCVCTARALRVRCACALRVCTACALRVRCACTACALRVCTASACRPSGGRGASDLLHRLQAAARRGRPHLQGHRRGRRAARQGEDRRPAATLRGRGVSAGADSGVTAAGVGSGEWGGVDWGRRGPHSASYVWRAQRTGRPRTPAGGTPCLLPTHHTSHRTVCTSRFKSWLKCDFK